MVTISWAKAGRPQTAWNQKVDDYDSWNITLLPHHQPIRRKSCTLQPSPQVLPLKTHPWKPITGSFEHEPLPYSLFGELQINTMLSFITTWCQWIGFALRRASGPKFSSVIRSLEHGKHLITVVEFLLLNLLVCLTAPVKYFPSCFGKVSCISPGPPFLFLALD